jgi:hypothetical protein
MGIQRKRSSSTIPFGYRLSKEDNKTLEPIDLELKTLRVVLTLVKSKALSLREGSQWIEYKTGRPLSHVGLKKIIDSGRGLDQEPEELPNQ